MLKEKLREIEESESQAAAIVATAQVRVEQIARDAANHNSASEESAERRGAEIVTSVADEAKPELLALLERIEESAAKDEAALRSLSEPRIGEAARALSARLLESGRG